jgi:hypothetical protein
MKKTILFAILFFATNLAYSLTPISNPSKTDIAIFKSNKIFIVLDDSTIIENDKFDFKLKWYYDSEFELLNGQKIKVKNIIAYKNYDSYYIRTKHTDTKYARCKIMGDINLFEGVFTSSSTSSSGNSSSSTQTINFIQKGNNEINIFDENTLANMMTDNPELSKQVKSLSKSETNITKWYFIGLLGYGTLALGLLALLFYFATMNSKDGIGIGGLIAGLVLVPLGIFEIIGGKKKGKAELSSFSVFENFINKYNQYKLNNK